MRNHKFRLIIIPLIIFVIWSCDDSNSDDKTYSRGDIRVDQVLGTFTVQLINDLLAGYDVDYVPEHTVQVVRIEYTTLNPHGQLTEASGALFYPVGVADLPVMEINHGTVTSRNLVASVSPSNSPEGAIGMLAASIGYFVILPDYLGLGISEILHPYVHAESNATAAIDFMTASYVYADENDITLSDQLFLGGYSEGGYNTLALQKEIEALYADQFDITAVCPMAGPYDLSGTVASLLQQDQYDSPGYIAYILAAYDDIYEWDRLDEIFQAPYAGMIPELFDGSNTIITINGQLPGALSQLLTPAFIAGVSDGEETDLIETMEENTLLDWSPTAPIRFVHSDSDEIVEYQNALTAVDNLSLTTESTVELITIEGGSHAGASVEAVEAMLWWFESLRD